jgi:signal transduction histidine kinase
MIARLETSFSRTRQFTSDASHELKTPLAILLGELEIALRRPLTVDEYRATLISCLEEVERLTSVVEGLLELSRADAGQVGRRFEQVRFSRLVEEICDDVQILAEAKRITVITNVQPDIQLDGDPVRLHQALLNVIENAVKYTLETGRVDVTVAADQRKVSVIVTDSGIGIDADDIPFIFDRFYRVDKARSQRVRGTGLGLAIAKWVVDAHDGSIAVASTPGVGSTFTIMLPLRHGSATS